MENKIGKGETILGKYNLYITSQNGIKLQSLYSFGKRVVGVGVVCPLPKIEFALGDNVGTLIKAIDSLSRLEKSIYDLSISKKRSGGAEFRLYSLEFKVNGRSIELGTIYTKDNIMVSYEYNNSSLAYIEDNKLYKLPVLNRIKLKKDIIDNDLNEHLKVKLAGLFGISDSGIDIMIEDKAIVVKVVDSVIDTITCYRFLFMKKYSAYKLAKMHIL